MKKTIKVYKVEVLEAPSIYEVGTHFQLEAWKNDTNYKGYHDGGKDYVLPTNIEVYSNDGGVVFRHNETTNYLNLVNANDKPVLSDGLNNYELKLSKINLEIDLSKADFDDDELLELAPYYVVYTGMEEDGDCVAHSGDAGILYSNKSKAIEKARDLSYSLEKDEIAFVEAWGIFKNELLLLGIEEIVKGKR